MRSLGAIVPLTASLLVLALAGCSKETPMQPAAGSLPTSRTLAASAGATVAVPSARPAAPTPGRTAPGRPGYEPAYVNGGTVMINAIEVPNRAPLKAQADFYEIVYPVGWEGMGIPPPQCDPCDHDGNGIDAQDYHDHVLDSAPGDLGYRALWHVFAVVPAYNGNAEHDAAINAAYKAHLPLKSEAAMDEFLALSAPGGGPVAVEIDAHFYFLCAVVSPNAAK